jgi:pimeloyl-ACP methyl ester carboxylesterase
MEIGSLPSGLPPLVLLHGLMLSGNIWQDTARLLASHHRVYTPTAPGHRGGPQSHRPVSIWDMVDAAERYLDETGLERPHLAGNSMGGFVAIELARRGRAASVCAISPSGFWSDEIHARGLTKVRQAAAMVRATRPLAPLAMKSPGMRRFALRIGALHGDQVSAGRAVEIARDIAECTVVGEIHRNPDAVATMDSLPCPITIAWAERDAVLPMNGCGVIARNRFPLATFTVLPDVAHIPMLDDVRLVAQTILATTGAAAI